MVGKTPRAATRGVAQGYIRLSEAFDLFYQAMTPDWEELDTAINEAELPKHGADVPRRDNDVKDGALESAFEARDTARRMADEKFRDALVNGELQAMIRDPDNGAILGLSPKDWVRERPTAFLGGFDDDFVEPGDVLQPGPDTTIRGFLQPVFLERQALERRIAEFKTIAAPRPGPKGGRPSSMVSIEAELDRWIKGGRIRLMKELKARAFQALDHRPKAGLAHALAHWSKENGGGTAAKTISKRLSKKLERAVSLLSIKK